MKNNRLTIALCLLAASVAHGLYAQNGINSPYSRYGFGLQTDRSMGFNKGMAGVAQGLRDGQIVNAANPASYSAVDSLTALFDMGLTLQNGNYKMGSVQQNIRNTSFDYIAMHFRAHKNVGIAFGLLPYTNINYNISSDAQTVEGNDDVTTSYTFKGSGGLHQVFFGMGWQFVKPISIGVNGSYLFGDYSHTTDMTFSEKSIYSMTRGYTADISTWMVDFGIQFTQPLSADSKLVIGASYGLPHDIKNKAVRYTRTYNSSTYAVEGQTADTIRNAFQLPMSVSAGVAYYKGNKLTIAADVELQRWSKSKFPLQNSDGAYISRPNQLNDRLRFAIGGSYSPKGRLAYKGGIYYSRSYAKADATGTLNDKPYEYGLTAGISMPIINNKIWYNSPRLNFSFGWTHADIPYLSNAAGTGVKQSLKENYLKFSVGLTFSERWFYKYKME